MATTKSSLICITCPKGCTLEITRQNEEIVEIKPGCKRGHEYARRELVDPRRMVASTVKISGGLHPLLPVYTEKPFPKPRIPELMQTLRSLNLRPPIKMGQVVLENALGTGINILASRNAE